MAKRAKKFKTHMPTVKQEGVYLLDGKEIPYILYFKSVKNYNMRVHKDGSLHISVPHGTEATRLWRFISSHEDFLRRALSRSIQQRACDRPLSEQSLADGTQIVLLDKVISLDVGSSDEISFRQKAVIQREICINNADADEIWHIRISDAISAEQQTKVLHNIIISEEMMRLHTAIEEILPQMKQNVVSAIENIYGISREKLGNTNAFPHARHLLSTIDIRLRNMKSRWGSCVVAKGAITFNARLIFTTKECLEYVICHELCHFLHPNHGNGFHALLQAVLPDAALRRKKLNGHDKTIANEKEYTP